jgi:HPt (histidine-containing phosphotransfer) domain-containing protein
MSDGRAEDRPLDPEALTRLRRIGGDTLVDRMIEIFLENAPARVATVVAAAARGDAGGVEQAAHSLKSRAANIGALRLYALSERAETNAATGREHLHDDATSIARELDLVRAALADRNH